MLVISRKSGEQIVIGENIELTIVAVRGGRVRIGLTAPRDVQFARREVRERMRNRPIGGDTGVGDTAESVRPLASQILRETIARLSSTGVASIFRRLHAGNTSRVYLFRELPDDSLGD